MPKPKAKPKKVAMKVSPSDSGLSPQSRNTATIILLALTFFLPLLGIVGVILMWFWTTWKKWVKILITIPFALAIITTVLLFSYLHAYRPFQMAGDSMYPNYKDGAYVMTAIVHRGDPIQRGTVLIYKNAPNAKDYIKRVIGLPGETVMLKNGSVYLNGNKLNESRYLPSMVKTYGGSFLHDGQSVKIPENAYFVLGDNRPFSSDSRDNGFVTQRSIISKASFCYWNCK